MALCVLTVCAAKEDVYAIQKCLQRGEGMKDEKGASCCWMFLVQEPQLQIQTLKCILICIFSCPDLFLQHKRIGEKKTVESGSDYLWP